MAYHNTETNKKNGHVYLTESDTHTTPEYNLWLYNYNSYVNDAGDEEICIIDNDYYVDKNTHVLNPGTINPIGYLNEDDLQKHLQHLPFVKEKLKLLDQMKYLHDLLFATF